MLLSSELGRKRHKIIRLIRVTVIRRRCGQSLPIAGGLPIGGFWGYGTRRRYASLRARLGGKLGRRVRGSLADSGSRRIRRPAVTARAAIFALALALAGCGGETFQR